MSALVLQVLAEQHVMDLVPLFSGCGAPSHPGGEREQQLVASSPSPIS